MAKFTRHSHARATHAVKLPSEPSARPPLTSPQAPCLADTAEEGTCVATAAPAPAATPASDVGGGTVAAVAAATAVVAVVAVVAAVAAVADAVVAVAVGAASAAVVVATPGAGEAPLLSAR